MFERWGEAGERARRDADTDPGGQAGAKPVSTLYTLPSVTLRCCVV